MRKITVFVAAAAFTLLAGCGTLRSEELNPLPNKERTPGVTNPDITQENIHDTICAHGVWTTKSIRPPVKYTNQLKRKQIEEYGYEDSNPKLYEEDHLIPLTLGGNPRDPRNLWPQPYTGEYGAHQKDKLENQLNVEVCAGVMTLKEGQECIAKDWVACFRKLFEGDWGANAKERGN